MRASRPPALSLQGGAQGRMAVPSPTPSRRGWKNGPRQHESCRGLVIRKKVWRGESAGLDGGDSWQPPLWPSHTPRVRRVPMGGAGTCDSEEFCHSLAGWPWASRQASFHLHGDGTRTTNLSLSPVPSGSDSMNVQFCPNEGRERKANPKPWLLSSNRDLRFQTYWRSSNHHPNSRHIWGSF